jgi:hypothetical protein
MCISFVEIDRFESSILGEADTERLERSVHEDFHSMLKRRTKVMISQPEAKPLSEHMTRCHTSPQ